MSSELKTPTNLLDGLLVSYKLSFHGLNDVFQLLVACLEVGDTGLERCNLGGLCRILPN